MPLLSNLDEYELLTVADALRVDFYESGAVIIRQGDVGDRFYIILEGGVTVLKDDGECSECVCERARVSFALCISC